MNANSHIVPMITTAFVKSWRTRVTMQVCKRKRRIPVARACPTYSEKITLTGRETDNLELAKSILTLSLKDL